MSALKILKCLPRNGRGTQASNLINVAKWQSILYAPPSTIVLRSYSRRVTPALLNSVSKWAPHRNLEPDWRLPLARTVQIQVSLFSGSHPNATIQPQKPESLPQKDSSKPSQDPKPSLWQRLMKMYREYWYVAIPVHTLTSIVWYGSFYYMAISGIDIVPLLERMGASEWILKTMKETGAGYFAVAYGMYKIATPARYTVTLGGTTITINYLKKWGYIKPMPSSEQMKAMLRERGRQLRSSRAKVLAKMNLRRKGSAKSRALEEEEKK